MPYCPACGFEASGPDAYCAECGSELPGGNGGREQEPPEPPSHPPPERNRWNNPRPASTSRDTHYYIGAVLTAICVIVFPYFVVFIAIPEAIAGLWGTSIQNSLSENARNNPYMDGSFLILRWFGNFLLLLLVLVIIAVALLLSA